MNKQPIVNRDDLWLLKQQALVIAARVVFLSCKNKHRIPDDFHQDFEKPWASDIYALIHKCELCKKRYKKIEDAFPLIVSSRFGVLQPMDTD